MDATLVNIQKVRFHLEKDFLPAEDLKRCVSDFLDMLKEISSDYAPGVFSWDASIEKGSTALSACPKINDASQEKLGEEEREKIMDGLFGHISEGFTSLSNNVIPIDFPDSAISHYQSLSKSFIKDNKVVGKPTLQVITQKAIEDPIDIRPFLAKQSKNEIDIKSIGSIEGKVKTLNGTNEPYFNVFDEGTNRNIKVHYDDDLLPTVRDIFLRNVRVIGIVHYDDAGRKIAVDAKKINVVNPDTEKTRLVDIIGILEG